MNEITHIEKYRHSLAHLLGASIEELYPGSSLTIGPATDDGFYYDVDTPTPIKESDFPLIEVKMREILLTWNTFTPKTLTAGEARSHFANNEYKLELIEGIIERGEEITTYQSGDFIDLCRGGHVDSCKEIAPNSFIINRIAGAYWRGDEKNKMLTRIYGIAFTTKDELENYTTMLEEAKKRDHRKIGREMDLFTTSDLVGAGLPLFKPKGMILRREIENFLWDLHKQKGYDRVWTPHLAKQALYETSGHLAFYKDDMFMVQGTSSKEHFCVKPMNCPHHMQIFADNAWSYRDMPVRYFEPATVYRDEKSGQLGGLTRVRSITQDDGHLFVRPEQIHQEISTIVSIIKEFYTTMGMIEGYRVRLGTRGSDHSQFMGSDTVWNIAEDALRKICEDEQLPYFTGEGEAAFYGPKLDFMFKDAIGREHQLGTIQCDFNLPERFDLFYTNEKGEKERPVVIHRAISGSLERFCGVMIEHFAGNFPLWLAPVQISLIPIKEEYHGEFSRNLAEELRNLGFRIHLDNRNESLGKRIRESITDRVPYRLVTGDKERDGGPLTLEQRDGAKTEHAHTKDVIKFLNDVVNNRKL